jgi:4-hydroxymandelate oxidase
MSDDPNDLAGFAAAARARLHPAVWRYLMGGDEAGANQAAWRGLKLRPRILQGVAAVDTETTVLGHQLAAPILVGPTGRATRYHPGGEAAVLAGARQAGSLAVLPSSVSPWLERLAARVPGAAAWCQLYLTGDRDHTAACLRRAAAAGCGAVVLTADLVPGGAPLAARLPPLPPTDWEGDAEPPPPLFAAATLDDLAWLCRASALPVVVKGVLRADDAEACIEAGARALVVSNHGGNQLESAVPTAEALPEVARAAAGRAEVYVDGGVRTGEDLLKALALGARAVLIGRPAAHGLTIGGAEGVAAVIGTLKAELDRAMRLCGCPDVKCLSPDLLAAAALR